MTLKRTIPLILVVQQLVLSGALRADTTDEAIQTLKEQIQALDQKVRILERQRELDQEAAGAKAKDSARVTVGANGLTVTSADTNFSFGLHGILQVDNRTFFNDRKIQGNDGFLLRRARPIFQGTVYRDIDFYFVPDFGGTSVQIYDAYLNYRYRPWLQLRAGKFKVPVGLEQLQADRDVLFNERSLATDLVPNRDIGFQLWGDLGAGTFSYALGVFNGVGDTRNTSNVDFEDHREFAGRIFAQPFMRTDMEYLQNFGLGVAGSWGIVSSNVTGLPGTTGGTLPGFTTDGQQQFFAYNPTNGVAAANGAHWRISPQGYWYYGPFGLMGEYVISEQRVSSSATGVRPQCLRNTAWEITGSWLFTGETASYGAVVPKHPFDPAAGHWGAFQVAARYAELHVDEDAFPFFASAASSASRAQAWSAGINWYLNRDVKIATSFSRTTFTGGGSGTSAPGVITRQPENALFTRLQLAF